MTKFVEFRTTLPFSLEQYEIASRYTSAKMKLVETGDSKGFEIIHNYEPFNHPEFGAGQLSRHLIHVRDQLPSILRTLLPYGADEIVVNTCINSPRSYTEITNPSYMRENFKIIVDETSESGNIASANPLKASDDKLTQRRVIKIDLLDPYLSTEDLLLTPKLTDLKLKARNDKPLTGNWQNTEKNQMVNYQLFEIEFKWWGLQESIEKTLEKDIYRILSVFFRRMYAWMDEWHGMSLSDVEAYEEEIKAKLSIQIESTDFTGMRF